MALKCDLPSVAYAELYKLLQEGSISTVFEPRLALIAEDRSLYSELVDLYEAKQRYDAINMPGSSESMTSPHPEFAAWLLSAGRGDSNDFSRRLRRSTAERLSALGLDAKGSPVITAWCLGVVVGNYDIEMPVAFAQPPADDNVRLAYGGLVEHLKSLGGAGCLPEMAATSVILRCAGLAQGVLPGSNLGASLSRLTTQVTTFIPEFRLRRLNESWDDFVLMRNAFAHVSEENGRSFSTELPKVQSREDMQDILFAVTHFVANTIREELANPDSDQGRRSMLRRIRDEMEFYTYA